MAYREPTSKCARCGAATPSDHMDMSADGPLCHPCSLGAQVKGHLGNAGGSTDVARAERSMLVTRYTKHLVIGGIGVVAGIAILVPFVVVGVASRGLVVPVLLMIAGGADFVYGLVGLTTKLPPVRR